MGLNDVRRVQEGLAVLADSLEDAGNENAQLLKSCRECLPEAAQAVVLAAKAYRENL